MFEDQIADSGDEGRIGQAGDIKIAVTLWGGYEIIVSGPQNSGLLNAQTPFALTCTLRCA